MLLRFVFLVSGCLVLLLSDFVLSTDKESLLKSALERFEYKYSFKSPALTRQDGTIPFFNVGGSASSNEKNVLLTPSVRNQRGWVWSTHSTNFSNFKVNMTARIIGRAKIGAEGLAFWYVSAIPALTEGNAFGSGDTWRGLAVMFDTYDNSGDGGFPMVQVYVNDGGFQYDHDKDGDKKYVGHCQRDCRNKPFPIGLVIEYYEKKLRIYVGHGMAENINTEYDLCFSHDNVELLPAGGYFGMSASTGDLADEHTVDQFLVHSLRSKSEHTSEENVASRRRLDAEYEAYMRKLEVEEQKRQDHEKSTVETIDTPFDQNIRLIVEILTDLSNKNIRIFNALDDMKQFLISSNHPDSWRGSEGSNTFKNDLAELHGSVRQNSESLRKFLNSFDHNVGVQLDKIFKELMSLRSQSDHVNLQNQQALNGINEMSNGDCISFRAVVMLLLLQLLGIISFFIYLQKKESRAKKLF